MDAQPKKRTSAGVITFQNWIARRAGFPKLGTYEYPFYTDAHITRQIQHADWPFSFLNTVPLRHDPGYVQPSIVLRVDIHLALEPPDFTTGDASDYHGGEFTDEIAALTSLCIGVRMRAGGESRRFDDIHKDPMGQPVAWDRSPVPILNLDKHRLVLPDIIRSGSLDELNRLEWLLQLSPDQTVALVRAARLYQDALWLAETEPSLSWLMLVSSLETAANQWRSGQGTAVERLSNSRPELVTILHESGGEDLVQIVASHIEQSLGATKKFIDFTLNYLPQPPEKRPGEAFQIPWTKKSMKDILGIVYKYRSNALHGGTPFPLPMCEPPHQFSNSEGYVERGTVGLAVSARGAVWPAKDLPINLHTFHYIVRSVLLSWWEEMANG